MHVFNYYDIILTALFLVRNDDFLESVPQQHRHMFLDEHPLAAAKIQMLRSMLEDRFPVSQSADSAVFLYLHLMIQHIFFNNL